MSILIKVTGCTSSYSSASLLCSDPKKGLKDFPVYDHTLNITSCFKYYNIKVSHVYISNFQGLFKNIVFRSVALVTKIFLDYFRFFSLTGLVSALYQTLCIKKKMLTKKSFKFLFIKSHKISQ